MNLELRNLEPLGDQGILVSLGSEADAARFAAACLEASWPWVVDVVLAYQSVAVFHDPEQIGCRAALDSLAGLPLREAASRGKLHVIPCCYERQLDLPRICRHTGLSADEAVARHLAVEYTVYAIGFCPGFPYLGYLDERLAGTSRLDQPRLRVEPGSVGLAGRQTGIYPLPRPGGWNLIGQTPLELVNLEEGYFPLRAGDRVRFERIDEAEFARLKGERLPG